MGSRGFRLQQLQFLGSRAQAQVHGLSYSAAGAIFPDQGSNPSLLALSGRLLLSHQGSPCSLLTLHLGYSMPSSPIIQMVPHPGETSQHRFVTCDVTPTSSVLIFGSSWFPDLSLLFSHSCSLTLFLLLVLFPNLPVLFLCILLVYSQYWRRKWQSTPVFLPGKSHRPRSLVGYSPWGCKELDMTERLHFTSFHS